MRIYLEAYEQNYHQQGKFYDNWMEAIKVLPFSSNPTSAFDKKCGLHGTTGEFYRILENDGSKPIEDFQESVINPITTYLRDKKDMEIDQVKIFSDMIKDILCVNGSLNITDSSFLKYLPLMANDERTSIKDRKKYSDGQKKLANYLYSMVDDDISVQSEIECNNLFFKILKEALHGIDIKQKDNMSKEYTILPFIKEKFNEDLKWMMEQEENVKVKYMHLFLHFYACYSVTQTSANISPSNRNEIKEPLGFYFILNSEKASINHDAVVLGWSHHITKETLDRLYGRLQALDILNSVLGGHVGFYHEIIDKLEETPFEENKDLCEELLSRFQNDKRSMFDNRTSESASIDKMDISINSYDEFIKRLYDLCTGLQSPSYIHRMRKKVIDLLSVRILQRRRGNFVLTLDNEMLIFLISMITKGKKVKLEKMYKLFNEYGIYFNRGSRTAIENYLLKLNLLDRKSDSGEAQYVTVIL